MTLVNMSPLYFCMNDFERSLHSFNSYTYPHWMRNNEHSWYKEGHLKCWSWNIIKAIWELFRDLDNGHGKCWKVLGERPGKEVNEFSLIWSALIIIYLNQLDWLGLFLVVFIILAAVCILWTCNEIMKTTFYCLWF